MAAKTGLRTEPDGPALARAQAAHRRQSPSRVIDELAADAAGWVLALTAQQEGRKAGMASKQFGLRNLLRDFWPPTQLFKGDVR